MSLRALLTVASLSLLTLPAHAVDLVSSQLCGALVPDRKSCAPGAELAEGATVAPGTTLHWLNAIHAEQAVTVYHVWVYLDSSEAPRLPNPRLNAFGDTSAILPALARIETPSEGVQPKAVTAVALGIKPAPKWSTRSAKDLPPGLTGKWRVELWTADATAPLASASFEVK